MEIQESRSRHIVKNQIDFLQDYPKRTFQLIQIIMSITQIIIIFHSCPSAQTTLARVVTDTAANVARLTPIR